VVVRSSSEVVEDGGTLAAIALRLVSSILSFFSRQDLCGQWPCPLQKGARIAMERKKFAKQTLMF